MIPLKKPEMHPFIDNAELRNYICFYFFFISISTLLFFCRPCGLSDPSELAFDAIGLVSPEPIVFMVPALIPAFSESHFFTDSDLFSESL